MKTGKAHQVISVLPEEFPESADLFEPPEFPHAANDKIAAPANNEQSIFFILIFFLLLLSSFLR